jgi:predicted nucleotide-binding protein
MPRTTNDFWHVSIETGKGKDSRKSVVNDLTHEEIHERVVKPWHSKRPFTISGLLVRSQEEVTSIRIVQTREPQEAYADEHNRSMEQRGISDFATDRRMLPFSRGVDHTHDLLFAQETSPAGSEVPAKTQADPKKVFIIHGRNMAAAKEIGRYLRALGLEPINFGELRGKMKGTPTVADIISRGMEEAQGVLALFTGDEWAVLRPEHRQDHDRGAQLSRWQARPNVLFEAGMAFGRDRERVVFVLLGQVELFTDVEGIHVLRPNNDASGARDILRRTLSSMGCAINDSSQWMTEGDFEGCLLYRGAEEDPADPFRKR